jgi:AcrR family transcriptional regulator
LVRRYRSPRRVEQAAATRRLILTAARRVFAEHGYAGATINAIAAAAQVAVPTVYASVGGKAAILAAFSDFIDEDSGVDASLQVIAAASRPADVLHEAVALTRRIAEQFGDILLVFEAAGPSDASVEAALEEGLRRHRDGLRRIAQRLDDMQGLRPDTSVDAAADTLAVLTTWRAWRTLTVEFGWSYAAAATWVEEIASRAVLAPSSSAVVVALTEQDLSTLTANIEPWTVRPSRATSPAS